MEGINRFGKPPGESPSETPANDAAQARPSARVFHIDDTMIGRRFQHFQIRARLGVFAGGVAYLADDTSLEQPVVLKVLGRGQQLTEAQCAEVLSAARRQARVAHQNVAQVRFMGVSEGCPFVVSEHVDGITLREEIKRNGAIPWTDAVAHMVKIVRALQAAETVGLAHGSLSPSRVIIQRGDSNAPRSENNVVNVKVDGFGVQPMAGPDVRSPYLSPEHRAGGLPCMRSDMYSLGVIFHEMLSAAPPQPGGRGLSERLAPHYVRRLVAFLLRDDPRQRPSGYEELLGRLEVALIEPVAARPVVSRAVAFGIDFLMMTLMTVASGVLLPRLAPASNWEAAQLGFVGYLIYSVLAHNNSGQTLGKQICGVMMMQPRQGGSWQRVLLRVLVQLWGPLVAFLVTDIEMGLGAVPSQVWTQMGPTLCVIGALWVAGFIVVLTDRKGTALHDHVTGTSVTFG